MRKLTAALPDDEHRHVTHLQDRIVLDAGGWLRDLDELALLSRVQAAVMADERIRIRYQAKDAAEPGQRTVDPWGLLQVSGTWYLVAAHRGQPRSYRVSRISAVTGLGLPSRRPPDLDLRKVWQEMRAEFRSGPSIEIELRIHPPRVPMVLRSLAVTTVGDPRTDEPGTIRLQVRHLRAAAAMLVGFGDEVEVIAPLALRHEIVAIAERARSHHGRDHTPG